MKKLTSIITLTMAMSLATVSAFAAPWSPQQQHRHQVVRHLNHGIAHQERQAQRSLWNGNIAGAMRHAAIAQNMAQKQHHVQHQIARSNHKWERSHVHCHYGYC